MRKILFVYCFLLTLNSFTQTLDNKNIGVFKTYTDYLNNSSEKCNCSIKKIKEKDVSSLKVNCKDSSDSNIFGIIYEENVWVNSNHKKKFYELKKDSIGIYYDLLNSKETDWKGAAIGGLIGGAIGGIIGINNVFTFAAINSSKNQNPLLLNVIIRFRYDNVSNKFYPSEFPNGKQSKVFYYYTKYTKDETPIEIELDNKKITLKKGSYYEEALPSPPPYIKQGLFIENNSPVMFNINVVPSNKIVILFSRDKTGAISLDHINSQMVEDFLKNKDKLEKINP